MARRKDISHIKTRQERRNATIEAKAKKAPAAPRPPERGRVKHRS